MTSRSHAIAMTCASLAAATCASATTITVRPDGMGDYTTIRAAVAAAAAHDSIEVGAGTYHEGEAIQITSPLVLYSVAGAATTVLHGNGSHRILDVRGTSVDVAGFTFQSGVGAGICVVSCGGAVLAWQGARATFDDCVFENSVGEKGGAFYVTDSNMGLGTSVTVRNSRFTGGHSLTAGSAAYVVLGATATFEKCVFDNNTTGVTAAIDVYLSHADIRECVFAGNSSNDVAGAVVYYASSGTIESNTFAGNKSLGAIAGTVLLQASPGAAFRRNIVAGESHGFGLRYVDVGAPEHGCNVFWNNAAGAIGGHGLEPDEIVADPAFCDAPAGDFTISDTSPAAPDRSPCGQLVGARAIGCHLPVPGAPEIASILDIPNDNGGQVRIRWQRSQYDAHNQPTTISSYGIYRRQDAAARHPGTRKSRRDGIRLDGWDFVAEVPARGDDVYQFVAPTLCDAPFRGEPCWSVFFVSAMTADPLTYFDSEPDSGYSEDNIPPGPPIRLTLSHGAGVGNTLAWESSGDVDLAGFRIYRDHEPDFVPAPRCLVGETSATAWLDAGQGSGVHYRVTAVDRSGQESPPTPPETIAGSEPGGVPARFALHPAAPNPFNPSTTIAYDVPSGGGHVAVRIHDASGRVVRTLVDRVLSEGRHRVVWDGLGADGRRRPSGTYFYRLEAPGYARTMKLTLLQ